ncbi:MAG: SLBB domain-containing protein [Acidobacteriia bacterium]|nr:SLBB domain-containing protein [Terriglobia bacterium]
MQKTTNLLLILSAFLSISSTPLLGQVTMQNRAETQNTFGSTSPTPPGIYGGYMIGIGDILNIHVNDEDSISGTYQVDQTGNVRVPLLADPIPAAKSTTFEFANRLSTSLKQQDILREPAVTVLIVRGMTQNVSVLGAVMRPGSYPIEKPTTLVDVISLAGGLAPNAGKSATVTHHMDANGASNAIAGAKASNGATTSVDLTRLTSVKDSADILQVQAGDVINVSTAPIVFVVGSVMRPGAFSVQDQKSQMTVMQAVAMAEGTTSTAALSRAIIIRQSSSDSQRQEIPIDLKKVMRGKGNDDILQANDILFVPQSGLKAGLHTMGQIGAQAAGQTVGYGLGLRIAP